MIRLFRASLLASLAAAALLAGCVTPPQPGHAPGAPAPPAAASAAGSPAPAPAPTPASAPVAAPDTTSAIPSAATGAFLVPAQGAIVHHFDGKDDRGIGIVGPANGPVVAAADGQVVLISDALPNYGTMVIIKHNETFITAYAQLGQVLVKAKDYVHRGQQIADMGPAPNGQGRLHFELRREGTAIDPEPYLSTAALSPAQAQAALDQVSSRDHRAAPPSDAEQAQPASRPVAVPPQRAQRATGRAARQTRGNAMRNARGTARTPQRAARPGPQRKEAARAPETRRPASKAHEPAKKGHHPGRH
jgi:lipoprotein NlpD